jgi:hypothetical protein
MTGPLSFLPSISPWLSEQEVLILTYEVRLIKQRSTDNDSAHQWMLALVCQLFKRPSIRDARNDIE